MQDIFRALDSADRNDPDAWKTLALNYAAACREYNENAGICRERLEKGQVFEAEQFAVGLTPSLERQQLLLTHPRLEEFLEVCSRYQCEEAPPPDNATPEALRKALLDQRNLAPLLDAYRQIARSDNTVGKLQLLRRIFALAPDPETWRPPLLALEKQHMATLVAEAKEAILSSLDFHLREILDELNSPEWNIRPEEKVIRKIERVLEEHRAKELEQQAALYLRNINDAYSNFDYPGLAKALERWRHFLEAESYNPDIAVAMQVEEAEEYFREQKKLHDAEDEFAEMVRQLRDGLEREAPLAELEKLHFRATMLNREFPEALEKTFLSYKESIEDIQRRRRLVKVAVIAVAIILSGTGVLVLARSLIEGAVEREWKARIETALREKPADVSLGLLADLEKKSPAIRQRPGILALAERTSEKKAAERENRRAFQELIVRIRKALEDFERNRDTILVDKAMALKLIADAEDQAAYQDVDREYIRKREGYISRQDKRYLAMINRIREGRREFFQLLEGEDFVNAKARIPQLQHLKDEAEAIPDVSSVMKAEGKQYLASLSGLAELLETRQANMRQRTQLLAQIAAPASLEAIQDATRRYIGLFPDRPETETFKQLLGNAVLAGAFAAADPKRPSSASIYLQDAKVLDKMNTSQKKLFNEATKRFDALAGEDQNSPTYAVILQSEDGILYDFYFFGKPDWERAGNACIYRVQALANGQGTLQALKLDFPNGLSRPANIFTEIDNFPGTLIYPKTLGSEVRELAPHVKLIQEIADRLKRGGERNVESVLIQAFRGAQESDQVNPYLRLWIARIISGLLADAMPENKGYCALNAAVEAEWKQIPENFNWLRSYREKGAVQRKLIAAEKKILAEIKVEPEEPNREIYEIALSRRLLPIGIAAADKNGEIQLVPFKNMPGSGEIWLVTPNQVSLIMIGEFAAGKLKISPENRKLLEGMPVLFSPTDGRSTLELDRKLNQAMASYQRETFHRPVSWPVIPY